MEDQQMSMRQLQEQLKEVEANILEEQPVKKCVVPTCLGSLIILLAATIAGAGVWWYAGSYIPPEGVDVSGFVRQMQERRATVTIISATEQEFSSYYETKEDGVHYKNELIEEADIETFEFLALDLAKDKNHVYDQGIILEGVDPENCTADNLDGCKGTE